MESTAPGPQPAVDALGQPLQSRAQRIWKISLRGLATVFAITGIGLQVKVITLTFDSNDSNDSYDSYYGYYSYLWVSPETFAFLGMSIIWNCAEFITFCVNKRGIHPGAHVGLDLIIWLGLLAAALTQLLIDFWNSTAVAAGTIKVICCILHFALFVWACVDTDRRRKAARARLIALVTAAATNQPQQNRQSTFNGTYAGPPAIPPGMVLVPIEMLQHMKYPAGQEIHPVAPQSYVSPISPQPQQSEKGYAISPQPQHPGIGSYAPWPQPQHPETEPHAISPHAPQQPSWQPPPNPGS